MKPRRAIDFLPIVGWIRTYDRSWLTPDAIAIVDVWSRSGATDVLGADRIFETTREAVAAAKGGD